MASRILQVVAAAVPVALCLYLLIIARSASEDIARRLRSWGPVMAGVSVPWLAYSLWRLYRDERFSVGMSDDGIRVDTTAYRWDEVEKAEFVVAWGAAPAIFLHMNDGRKIGVPNAIKDILVLWAAIKEHVPNVVE
jgi:hypothetical protein